MKLLLSVVLLLRWMAPPIQAGSIANSLNVLYRKEVALGEQASVTVTNPENVFFQLFTNFYAANGTVTTSSWEGNVPFNLTNGSELHNNTVWTCTTRDDWGPGRLHFYKDTQSPDSTAGGWGYRLVLKLFYPSPSGYIYGANVAGINNVCILTPYTTQELQTEIHNFTVNPLANGASTTSLSSPTSGAAEGSLDGQYSFFSNEQWTFTEQPTGQSFDVSPVPGNPSSGVTRVPLAYGSVIIPLLSLVFSSL